MIHKNQIPIPLTTARTLIHDQFPQYRTQEIHPLPSTGTVNAIFRIGKTATARFPLQSGNPEFLLSTLHKEANAMTEFSQICPFPSPLPLGIGHDSSLHPLPWSIQTWLEGDIASPTSLSNSKAFAKDITHLLATLRSAGTKSRTFTGQNRGGNLLDHDKWMRICLDRSHSLLDVPRLEELWTKFRALPRKGRDVMAHGDLTPFNILVRDGRIVGVLDTGGFGAADPALDLVVLWHVLDAERRDQVRKALRVGEVEWLRGAAWAFEQAMGLVWYYAGSKPELSALGKKTLERIVEDREVGALV